MGPINWRATGGLLRGPCVIRPALALGDFSGSSSALITTRHARPFGTDFHLKGLTAVSLGADAGDEVGGRRNSDDLSFPPVEVGWVC